MSAGGQDATLLNREPSPPTMRGFVRVRELHRQALEATRRGDLNASAALLRKASPLWAEACARYAAELRAEEARRGLGVAA